MGCSSEESADEEALPAVRLHYVIDAFAKRIGLPTQGCRGAVGALAGESNHACPSEVTGNGSQ